MMTTISELTEKADYIAKKNARLMSQWMTYQNSLVKAVTTSKKKLNHEFTYGHEHDIRFLLFNYFTVSIQLSDDFYSQDINYRINLSSPLEEPRFMTFAHALLDENGKIDGDIDNNDLDAVLNHYLNKIDIVYQSLFDSLQDNHPINEGLKKIVINSKNGSVL